MLNNRREDTRVAVNLPVEICIGSQVTIQGQLKDISSKSAFILIKSSVFMQLNDEFNFLIKCSAQESEDTVGGVARISRIAAGEGIAIYFTKMERSASARLKQLVG